MWQIDLNGYDINSLELVTYDTKHTVLLVFDAWSLTQPFH